jgi:8-oxo-dGTP pyrophosphatase MutT (NUDIX family)
VDTVYKDLLNGLRHYAQRYTDEADTVRHFTELMEEGTSAFQRDHLPGHFTASAWAVNHLFSDTLLVHHRSLGMWVQPGGHADGETDLLCVAERELREETGIRELRCWGRIIFDLAIHRIPVTADMPSHLHFDVRFLFMVRHEQPLQVSIESNAVRWVSLDTLEDFSADQSVLRMRDKCRAYAGSIF